MSAAPLVPRLAALLACVAGAFGASGCLIPGVWPLHDDDPAEFDEGPEGDFTGTEAVLPPSVDTVNIPDWPPLGPFGVLTASLRDDLALDRVTFDFQNHVTRTLDGGAFQQVAVTGQDLGEGLGTLQIQVFDREGAFATRGVTDLLVDLSPPKADLGKTVVRAEGDHLEMWVSDAWVLGAVTLTFQGSTQQKVFDPVYPATLGESWDYSLVKFSSEDLPEGKATAELVVTDAAGNTSLETFELTVDGKAPLVSIQEPAAGAVVSGPFELVVMASDEEGGATWIEIELAGSPIASAVGLVAAVALDAAEFSPGPTTITVRARDEAGNESVKELPLIVE